VNERNLAITASGYTLLRTHAALREGDLVQQPIGSAPLGDVFRALGEQHGANKTVAIPLFRAAELPQIGSGDGLPSVMTDFLSFLLRGAAAAAPLPVGETGVASRKGLLGRPSKATPSARQRNGVCFLRRKSLAAREGGALSGGPRPRPYELREGALPGWAETRSGSVRLRVAPGPQGHPGRTYRLDFRIGLMHRKSATGPKAARIRRIKPMTGPDITHGQPAAVLPCSGLEESKCPAHLTLAALEASARQSPGRLWRLCSGPPSAPFPQLLLITVIGNSARCAR
jgi:hypothetical protein